ncbi:ROK family transcriptional regulator [Actinoplanes sp. NPDC024001]|uniref:ROK family transcriptional regulator n=1 Tax=Actinoplanes sp. NPDC024001 TaxID=3154598 RepID=UPI0033D00D4D
MAISPQEAIHRRNLGALLRYVHLRGAASRAELTAGLGLNRSTIGALAARLAEAGLVREETPPSGGRAGRPSLMVRPDPTNFHAYALSVEVDRLRAARIGLGGEILDIRTAELAPGADCAAALDRLAALVDLLRPGTPAGGTAIGVGVALAGETRGADGTIRFRPAGAWTSETVSAALGLDRPCRVGNLADLAARAEHARGSARGLDDVVYLHGDAGISAGIITSGLAGTGRGIGGQVGHMVVNPAGRACRCGSRGCWETEIGEPAVGDRAGVLALVAAARAGEPAARDAVRRTGEWLGHGVANLVNILNPEAVVFGGTLREIYRAAAGHVRGRLLDMALPAFRERLRLSVPVLGDDAALVGAAELAFEQLLNDPLNTPPLNDPLNAPPLADPQNAPPLTGPLNAPRATTP